MPSLFYDAPLTCARFMKSEAFGRLIAGPVGSGKTTSCVMELFRRSIEQRAGNDGLSHTRFAVVRQTLKQLKDTVLKDCQSWLGGLGQWKVSENTFFLNFDNVRSEFVFIPLEDAEDQGRLLSMQLTGAWLSECIEMDYSVLGPISGRCGRYPSGNDGVPTWHGMIADTNMPTELTPWHKHMVSPPPDWQVFIQPSGLDNDAENLNWLLQNEDTMKLPINDPVRLAQGRKYYERLINMYGDDSAWVKRYVKAQFGDDPSGHAVFRESFKLGFHVVDDEQMQIIPGYPLIVGQDFGRDPWSLICQPDHLGRLLVHEEVKVPPEGLGLEKHIQQSLRPALFQSRYLGQRIAIVGDPSGIAKNNVSEETNFDAMQRLGFAAFPAPTNDLDPRLRSVESYLARQVNGGPAILINKQRCPTLVRALSGGYRFSKMKTNTGERRAKPDKNEFSHIADCLEYVCLVCHGGMVEEIAQQLIRRPRAKRPPIGSKAWT